MSTYRFPLASEKKVPAYVGDQSFSKSLNAGIELLRDHKKGRMSTDMHIRFEKSESPP
jgi:hypothetical protein